MRRIAGLALVLVAAATLMHTSRPSGAHRASPARVTAAPRATDPRVQTPPVRRAASVERCASDALIDAIRRQSPQTDLETLTPAQREALRELCSH